MKRQSHARYLRALGSLLLLGVLLLAGLNLLVNPFGAYPGFGLRSLETFRDYLTRAAKAELVEHNECDVIILGSSRPQAGFRPDHPAFNTPNVLNLGLNGACFEELQQAFAFAVHRRNVRLVVMALDLPMFGAMRRPGHAFTMSRFNPNLDATEYHLANLLGWDATVSSLEVLGGWLGNQPVSPPGHGFRKRILAAGRQQRALFESHSVRSIVDPILWGGFRYDVRKIARFREIVRVCRQRDIRLVVILPPLHALELETMNEAGFWNDFEQWKRDLVMAIAAENATEPVAFWDFTAYEGPSAERVPPRADSTTRMKFFFESSHFTPALGDLVLDRVLGQEQANSNNASAQIGGVRLMPDNVEAELRRVRIERETYIREFPLEIEFLKRVFANAHKSTAKDVSHD